MEGWLADRVPGLKEYLEGLATEEVKEEVVEKREDLWSIYIYKLSIILFILFINTLNLYIISHFKFKKFYDI